MARVCTICAHPDRAAIESAILSGESNRRIASQCDVSEISIRRHQMAGHVAEIVVKAHDAAEVIQADSLLDQIRSLQQTTLRILARAEKDGKYIPAIMAIKEARGNLELLAKMLGELDERPVVNIATNPQWLTIQAVIMNDLADDPERRIRLATKLAELAG